MGLICIVKCDLPRSAAELELEFLLLLNLNEPLPNYNRDINPEAELFIEIGFVATPFRILIIYLYSGTCVCFKFSTNLIIRII